MAIVRVTGKVRPRLDEEELTRRCALAEAKAVAFDDKIDCSDMPELIDEELAEFMPWEIAEKIRKERREERKRMAKELANTTDLTLEQIAKVTRLDLKQIEALAPAH